MCELLLYSPFHHLTVSPEGIIFTIAGFPALAPNAFYGDGGTGVFGRMNNPMSVLPDGFGGVLIGMKMLLCASFLITGFVCPYRSIASTCPTSKSQVTTIMAEVEA